MLDTVLVANETIDEAKRREKKCLVFKVDFKKAYDCVCWKFLLYMLKRMRFSGKWVSWIKKYALIIIHLNIGKWKSYRRIQTCKRVETRGFNCPFPLPSCSQRIEWTHATSTIERPLQRL